ENHAQQLVSIDFFIVSTIRFQVLYVFLVLAHDRRRILHFHVTAHPTAEWTGQQLREAFSFEEVPRYLLRDRDAILGRNSASRSPIWGSRKFSRHREVRGSGRISNGSSVPSGASAWTIGSCSTRARFVEPSLSTSTTITDLERICPWTKTRRSRDRFSHRKWGESLRCRRWVGYTTATNDGPPESPIIHSPRPGRSLNLGPGVSWVRSCAPARPKTAINAGNHTRMIAENTLRPRPDLKGWSEAAIEEIAAQLAFEVAETPALHVLEDAAAQEAIGSDAGAAGAGGVGVAADQAGAHHVDEFVVVEQ
ncbi:MAG TPA: hypothetical protein VM912_06065, partial [Terriglobales bacterium]|nr:hypothetical protein [Terriglobales bacterium]